MTTTATRPSASSSSSGASPQENAAAAGFTVMGFLLGGPVGAVIAALSVGIERAFMKSGWERPGMLGGHADWTPEQWAEHRANLAEQARETLRGMRERAEARAKVREEHRKSMQDYLESDRQGDKPVSPGGGHRNPWEFLRDFLAASKSGYRLFDDKMARGNERVTATYPVIGGFFKSLWGFVTGLIEGTQEGWQQYQQEKQRAAEEAASENAADDPDRTADYSWGPEQNSATDDGPNTEPTPLPPPDEPRPAVDPATEGTEPDPATGSGPIPAPEPSTPLPGPEPTPLPQGGPGPDQLPTGPAGSGEGTVEGELLSPDNTPVLGAASGAAPAHQNTQGETNLDLIYQAFHPIPPLLRSADQQLPDLEKQQANIATRLSWIRTLAGAYGVPTAVWAYLAEAAQVSAALASGLATIKTENAMAQELAEEALMGLQPASDDLDVTHAEGASGEIYAAADEVAA